MRKWLVIFGVQALAAVALAVTTSSWTDTDQDDFAAGEIRDVVITSMGELRLSRDTQMLLRDDARLDVIHSLAQGADGTTYLGTGPDGVILRRTRTGEVTSLYQAGGDALITAMYLTPTGQLFAGISGKPARLLRIDVATARAQELFSTEDLQFIWAILPRPDGSVLLGTGPTGKLIEVSPEGRSRIAFASKQHNLTCLLSAGGEQVIVGTDPEGLVVRVNPRTGDWFVLYDAGESQITALAQDADGSIYAAATTAGAAAAVETARPGGRPQISPQIPLRREPPGAPEPPPLPEPSPGEPEPIPKSADTPKHMSVLETELDPDVPQTQPSAVSGQTTAPATPGGSDTEAVGSAVYRISPSGFATEALRRSGTIHCILWTGRSLLLGTGPEGEVVEFQPVRQEAATLWRGDARHVSALLLTPSGNVLLGLSSPGMLVEMGGGHARAGTFTSQVFDATHVARFGKLQLEGTLAAHTSVTVATRSGNTGDPDEGGWSAWSQEAPAAEFLQVPSPSARFMQYRLTLATQDPVSSPTIEQVKVNYALPNMAPKVSSITVEPEAIEGDAAGAPRLSPATYTIRWDASDANNDDLVDTLHYRLGHQGQWIVLKGKLTETKYQWKTRELADGRYQVRITVSDERSNPPGEALTGIRFSDAVIIDNTPPAIGDIKTTPTGDGAEIALRVVDRTSTVAGVEYAVDSGDDWQAAPSSDMLYDSPDETVKFAIAKLAGGPHQVAIRAADSKGNTAYETLIITVPERKQEGP